jgi:hypothetical protein
MGFLRKGNKINVPELTGLQIQTSVNALPIPIVYGCPRIPMNIIYANGFRAVAQKSSGGKGILSGGKGTTTGYNYYATFIGAGCEGLVSDLLAVYDDQQVYNLSTVPPPPGKIMQPVGGDQNGPWAYITLRFPSDALTYPKIAYVGFLDYPLDSSGTLPQLNFVVKGPFQGTSPLNAQNIKFLGPLVCQDADPAECIIDLLTNPTYGADFPSQFLDVTGSMRTTGNGFDPTQGDATLSTYCQAVGMAYSVVLNNAEAASSIIERWCKNLAVAIVWTGQLLKFIPYWDTGTGENPGYAGPPYSDVPRKYYNPTPIIQSIVSFGPNNFIQSNATEDPVTVTRIDPADAKNVVRVDYRDRDNIYNDIPTEVSDENQIELYGRRVDDMATGDEFTALTYANVSAQVQLQRYVAIRNTYTFKLDLRWCFLDPMDVVQITEPGIGLSNTPVRIRSIEEDEKGVLTIIAEEFPLGSASASTFNAATNAPAAFNFTNTPAQPVNTPVIFEPTAAYMTAFSQPSPTIAIAASGGPSGVFDPNWGGCVVNVSSDNISYVDIGSIVGPSRMGVSTNTLGAYVGGNPDLGHTLSVDLSESGGTLQSVTDLQASQAMSLCALVESDGSYELLAYTTATLTGPNTYDLTGLYRGLFDTVACSHPSGNGFCFIDNYIFQGPLPTNLVGTEVYVKLQSFNLYHNETQDISTCTAYTYTPTGAGVDLLTNPVFTSLLNGIGVDLDTFAAPPVDLNSGGAGVCAPTQLAVDLQTL